MAQQQEQQGAELDGRALVASTFVVDVNVREYFDEYGTGETLGDIAAYVRERLADAVRAEFAASAHWAKIRTV